jgi:hypothetical protein
MFILLYSNPGVNVVLDLMNSKPWLIPCENRCMKLKMFGRKGGIQ